MTTEIKVPTLGESVSEATVAKWFKAVGDAVAKDEPLLELETDKVTLEVPSPVAGRLSEIVAGEAADVGVGALLGRIEEGQAGAKSAAPASAKAPAPAPAPTPAPAAKAPALAAPAAALALPPAVRKLVEENKLDAARIPASGKDGRLTKADVLAYLENPKAAAAPAPKAAPAPSAPAGPRAADAREERVRMTRLRRTVAERLKAAQNTAAMLTTFNEVDMTAVNDLRKRHQDAFEKKHGVRIGFMSIFAKACVSALKAFPAVNAEIDGDDIVYKNYYDIGIAVG